MQRRAGVFAHCGAHARSWGARRDVGAARTRLPLAFITCSSRALIERILGRPLTSSLALRSESYALFARVHRTLILSNHLDFIAAT